VVYGRTWLVSVRRPEPIEDSHVVLLRCNLKNCAEETPEQAAPHVASAAVRDATPLQPRRRMACLYVELVLVSTYSKSALRATVKAASLQTYKRCSQGQPTVEVLEVKRCWLLLLLKRVVVLSKQNTIKITRLFIYAGGKAGQRGDCRGILNERWKGSKNKRINSTMRRKPP